MSQTVDPAVGFAPAAFLAAVSAGSVFMGANSYIGNAPNFMVSSIAEEQEVHDAQLLRLHRLGAHLPDPGLHPHHVHLLRLAAARPMGEACVQRFPQ